MTEILALYRGDTVAEARLVAITVDREIVSRFAEEFLGGPQRSRPEAESARVKTLSVVRDDGQ